MINANASLKLSPTLNCICLFYKLWSIIFYWLTRLKSEKYTVRKWAVRKQMKIIMAIQKRPPNIDLTDRFPYKVSCELVWKISKLLIGVPHFYTVRTVGTTSAVLSYLLFGLAFYFYNYIESSKFISSVSEFFLFIFFRS